MDTEQDTNGIEIGVQGLVRVARLERAASCSQSRRPTNWATPGFLCSRGGTLVIIKHPNSNCKGERELTLENFRVTLYPIVLGTQLLEEATI